MTAISNPPGQGVEWNIAAVGAPQVWAAGDTGAGIVVAGADTGVDWTHPALQSKYRGWADGKASHDYNWFDPWDGTAAPWDDNGHGTYTIGLAVGGDGADNQIGMAPGAQWIACRNMRYGVGNPGAYISCMEFFLAPFPHGGDPFRDGRPDLAPDVINNSWGCPPKEGCRADTLSIALQNLKAAGIMMVAAAGNDGPACSTATDPPANSGAVFTVGASDQKNALAFFSSRGPDFRDAQARHHRARMERPLEHPRRKIQLRGRHLGRLAARGRRGGAAVVGRSRR